MNSVRPYIIGVSCIGSGIGKSVIDSLRLSSLPIRTIGFGTNPLAFGSFDCDDIATTLSIYHDDYIDHLIETYHHHHLDLIIPGLDDEVLLFAKNRDKLEQNGIHAIYAGLEITTLACDKERMSLELNHVVDSFVKCYQIDDLLTNDSIRYPLIAKPKSGFASRGVQILLGKEDLHLIHDGDVIQELAKPHRDDPSHDDYLKSIQHKINSQVSEISIQVVLGKNGELIGRMMSHQKLSNGIPIEIIPYENEEIWAIVDKLTPVFAEKGLVGPINIQGRLTDDGFKIFELNPRFTGITGLRALMGFNEVEACVKSWLGLDKGTQSLRVNHDRIGIRQTASRVVSHRTNEDLVNMHQSLNGRRLKPKQTLLITGTSGYLGYNLLLKIRELTHFEYDIVVLNRTKQDLDNIPSYTYDDLFDGRISLGHVDVLLHLAFTRPHGTAGEIANSLKLTQTLFTLASQHHVPNIINMSSQSVYGTKNSAIWTEDTATAPETVYGQAKYAAELLLDMISKHNPQMRHTSIRLGTLTGGAPKYVDDLLGKFATNILSNRGIHLQGGNQILQRFDIRDAIDAILVFLKSDPNTWSTIYNLGNNAIYSLTDIATLTSHVGKEYATESVTITVEPSDLAIQHHLDSTWFFNAFHWQPSRTLEETIHSVFRHKLTV